MTIEYKDLRIVIVAEHASAKFGGEAVLPLHYFRLLKKRNIPVWLVVNERTKPELLKLFPEDTGSIQFVPDTWMHRVLWSASKLLPDRVANFTFGFIMRVISQVIQRRIIRKLIKDFCINVIHQPMPVSPKEPSLLYGLGVATIIGPMNGGMNYPPAFIKMQSNFVLMTMTVARSFSSLINIILPGKRRASLLLVANERTKNALPGSLASVNTEILVENGVDLSLWKTPKRHQSFVREQDIVHFVYMGRLVDWKAVDILIRAFAEASKHARMTLSVIGDGDQSQALQQIASTLGILGKNCEVNRVTFLGWRSQIDCARYLEESDALVLTSLMECGGAVVLEAMAMGLPVIATDWGGPVDYIDDSCGILVQPSGYNGFIIGVKDALCKLAQSPELRHKMGMAGRAKVEREFDWEVKIDRMLDIYSREASKWGMK